MQGRLILPDNAELRSEFIGITVKESASDPGYAIDTGSGHDDMADAAVMAVTEALRPKRPNSVVHDFGAGEVVIPPHQQHLGIFFGSKVPVHAIDQE